ncbi:hypothetical protein EV361DRAFT_119061 [Lentinula raphanica]|nr:hypothetical protein EV361DRAFT_119061 [Lentinula raphanica]
MLRWLQSRVQIIGASCVTTSRLHLPRTWFNRGISSAHALKLKTSIASTRSVTRRVPNTGEITRLRERTTSSPIAHEDAPKKHADATEELSYHLTAIPATKVLPETLASLYDSVRTNKQLKSFSAVQLSTLIKILGSFSLQEGAQRDTTKDSGRMAPASSYWSHVLRIVEDKKALGLYLNDGDHYWLMSAWLARYSSERDVNSLSNASIHYGRIWRKTKFPDILIPYLEALLSTGHPEHLKTAVVDFCGILNHHSNLHGRSLNFLWDLTLSFPNVLTAMKEDILQAMWNRTTMSHAAVQRSHPMATHMFNPFTERHERLPLSITHLITALGTPLFPFFQISLPLSVQQWARRQVHAVLSPACAIETRWTKFSLFALNHATRDGLGSRTPVLDLNSIGSHFEDWHVVLTLSILENVVNNRTPPSQGSAIRSILGVLWEQWIRIQEERPVYVSRAVVGSFLQLSARTQDAHMLGQCRRYSIDNALWAPSPNHTAADRTQIEALVGHYLEASVVNHGKTWPAILAFLSQQDDVFISVSPADFVIEKFLPVDVETAQGFYEFCVEHDIPVGADTTAMLAIALLPIRIHDVFAMLERVFDNVQMERVLIALLETLRTQRYQYLTQASGRILGRVLRSFLQTQTPSLHMKYGLRYCLSRLVVSGCTADAIRIVELVNQRVPSFLNPRFLQRLLGIFLRHRQYRFAVRLYSVAKSQPVDSQNRFRRKLVDGLIKGRATGLARQFRGSMSSLSKLDRMLRGTGYRKNSKSVWSVIRKNPRDLPSIKYAFTTLLLSKRPLAATRVFQRSLPYLDPPTKLWMGNMFLHRILHHYNKRNIQVVKKTLRAKNYLMANFGFAGDRVTFNILMKSLLHWKNISSSKARMLFDDCIRMGYPVGSRWRRVNNVPFGTQYASPVNFGLSTLDGQISFRRHVRPLYKLFIKAFYLRKDAEAAKTVIGILKNEEVETILKQQQRDRSRLVGLQKVRSNRKRTK